MSAVKIFLSYSRQQLYFAEALSLQLQKSGMDVWMDLQQLEPGDDWEAEIKTALRECTALVLVASRQSLASSYVKREWESAQASGKPIHVVLYEAVELPWGLQTAGHIDFRGSFKPALLKLVDCLKNNRYRHDPLPKPNLWDLPTRLPPGVSFIFWSNLVWALLAIPLLTRYFPFFSPPLRLVYAVGVTALILWITWKLLHHKMAYAAMGLSAILPFVFVMFQMMPRLSTDDIYEPTSGIFLVLTSMATYFLLYFVLGAGLLRWSVPAEEEDIQRIRRLFNRPLRGKRKQASATEFQDVLSARSSGYIPKPSEQTPNSHPSAFRNKAEAPSTFTLQYGPADRPIASSIRRALAQQRLSEVDQNGQIHILILTGNSTHADVQAFLTIAGRKVTILADNLDLQNDPLLEKLTRLQLIDYRERSGGIVKALARTLSDPLAINLPTSVEITPRPLQSFILPIGVRQIGMTVQVAGVYLLLSGLATLAFSFISPVYSALIAILSILLGLFLLQKGKALWLRRVTRLTFTLAFAFSMWVILTVTYVSFFLAMGDVPYRSAMDWVTTPYRLAVFEDWFCFLPFTILSTCMATIPMFASSIKVWLPAGMWTKNKSDSLKLISTPLIKRWTRKSWLIGAILTFGMPIVAYLIRLYFTEAFSL